MKNFILIISILTICCSCTKNKLTLIKVVDEELALELTDQHNWYENEERYISKGLKTPFGNKKAIGFNLAKMKADFEAGKLIATSDYAIAQSMGADFFARVGIISINSKTLKKNRIGFSPTEGAGKRICQKLLTMQKEKFEFVQKDEKELRTLSVFFNGYAELIKDSFFEAAITARAIRDELKPNGKLDMIKSNCEYFVSIK
jgi:hypothetical protein